MHIANIISRKGAFVCTIDQGQPMQEAVRLMHEARIGAVVVVNAKSKKPLGLISQTEILAGLHDIGADALLHCATGIMRMPVPQCSPNATTQDAMSQMTRERTRHLLVVGDNGIMTGIVSLGDLVASRLDTAQLEANVLRDIARSHLLTVNG